MGEDKDGSGGSARTEILDRIRAALGPAPAPVTVPRAYRTGADIEGAGSVLASAEPRLGLRPPGDRVDLLVDRLVDYRATVYRCTGEELAATIAQALAQTRLLAVPPGIPGDWLAAYPGTVVRDGDPQPLTVAELDAPGVTALTGCAVAIAETGTLILDAGPESGRRALTLVPDHHACVVHSGQVVLGVPAALARLADPTRPLTMVSGPSATSDIELNRVEGVHGPRRLDVILVT